MRDGSRLTPYMAYQIERLNKDLIVKFNVEVKVTSGVRLPQEQIDVFLKRYVTAGAINGRRVYDTRIWNGVRYYRISAAGTVASPGSSNHEIQGNRAAVDLRDTGADAGLMYRGSVRSNWLKANAANYDLVPSGFNFDEPWHYDVLNVFAAVPGTAPAAPATPASTPVSSNPFGIPSVRGLQKVARLNGYKGAIDNDWGAGSAGGFASFLRRYYGYSGNNTLGPVMWKAIARWLRVRWGYKGNDVPGPVMRARLAEADAANERAL